VVDVPAERFGGWLTRFVDRHGELSWEWSSDRAVARAADGAVADCLVPFPPLPPATGVAELVAHVERDRMVGVLLVRKGGYAAGVFRGSERVLSKVGNRLVQGRAAAGGSSQQRFARRRENQARRAYAAASDVAAAILLPEARRLEALVLGGDRRAVEATLADPRLVPLRRLPLGRFLTVPDPRLRVLVVTPEQFRAVAITLTGPTED